MVKNPPHWYLEVPGDRDHWENIKERYVVAGDPHDIRLHGAPRCELLTQYRIAHLGVLSTGAPYELTRAHQTGSCIIVTLAGKGKVFIDGLWVSLNPDNAALLPPFSFNSIRTVGRSAWTFAWVKYLEEEGSTPIVTSMSPIHGKFDAKPLHNAAMGLHAACMSGECPSAQNLWVELIHKYVTHFAQPKIEDERLWSLWGHVENSLAHPWKLRELAEHAHMSPEHLRRLCKKQFGRSPKQQLCFLRMRKARILLCTTSLKIEAVGKEVGYENPYAFSNTFKKVTGFRPSDMR